MFCPRCSQEQVSDEIRYCSKCGLSLSAVAETLKYDNQGQSNHPISVKDLRRSVAIGFGLVTLSGIFLLATLIIGAPEPSFMVQMNVLVAVLIYLSAVGYVYYKFYPYRTNRLTDIPAADAQLRKSKYYARFAE